uniref:Uncharacterized protein n=1 Tax=Opuntia streptacantha TaxID=393608 RepID=A0A7C9AJ73_OPUST
MLLGLYWNVNSLQNRLRNPAMAGGYPQQGYQAQPTSWAPQPPQAQQPGSYGYMQQPGAYPGAPSQYGMSQPPYSGYTQQTAGGYAQNWDQSSAPQSQQAPQGTGYDYYGQQAPPQQQQQPASGPPTDNTGYNYSQPPTSGGYGQQGYTQDGYGGGYQAPPTQHGYGQPPANPPSGYDQQQGYGSTAGYGNVTNPQDGHPPSYSAPGETGQLPPQQGYPTQGSNQAGYGMAPTSQAGYGTPSSTQGGYNSTPGYGPPQGQRTPTQQAYGQPQQSPSQGGGYTQPAAGQAGYPPSQPPAQSGYGQADALPTRGAAAPTYGSTTTQPAPYPSPYGAAPVTPPSYGQQPPTYYGGAYSQPPAYPTDGGAAPPAPASQAAVQPSSAAKTSPQS